MTTATFRNDSRCAEDDELSVGDLCAAVLGHHRQLHRPQRLRQSRAGDAGPAARHKEDWDVAYWNMQLSFSGAYAISMLLMGRLMDVWVCAGALRLPVPFGVWLPCRMRLRPRLAGFLAAPSPASSFAAFFWAWARAATFPQPSRPRPNGSPSASARWPRDC